MSGSGSGDIPESWKPAVNEVGALVRARTKDDSGNELGTFTAATRPTSTEVGLLIDMVMPEIAAAVVAEILPEHYDAARRVVTLRVAMHIESGFFSEQTEGGDTAYARFAREYAVALGQLIEFVQWPTALRIS